MKKIWANRVRVVAFPLSFLFFMGAAFNAYYEKDKQLEATQILLVDSNNAEGLLALGGRTQHLAMADYVFVDFENASPSKALAMRIASIEVSTGGQFLRQDGGDCCSPLAPLRKTSIDFKFEPFGNEPSGRKINFLIRGNYGFAGSSVAFKICEAMVCDLAIGEREAEMKFLACYQKGCP